MKHFSTIMIALLLVTVNSSVWSKESILWVKWNLQPEYIDSGAYKGQGYLDKFLRYVQAQLPEYHHHSEYQTLNRLSVSWAQGNVCAVHIWLGYWPDKIVYSRPYAFTPRFGIVARKDSKIAQQFKDKETLSLKHLLANTPYKMGMLPLFYEGSKDSRYPLMAPLIEPYLNTQKVHEFSNSRNEVTVAYLERQRVDYLIRQSITQNSELRTKGLPNQYRFFFLEEGGRHKLVATACSNSTLGKTVVAKVDKLISPEFHLQYLTYRQEWDPTNARFDKAFVEYFIDGIQHPQVTQ